MTQQNRDFIKVCVVGKDQSGKTSWIKKLKGETTRLYQPTIGSDFSLVSVIFDRQKQNIQIWDLAGSERFSTLITVFLKLINILIIFVDLSSEIDIEHISIIMLINVMK